MQEAEPVMQAGAALPVVVWHHPPANLPKLPIGVSLSFSCNPTARISHVNSRFQAVICDMCVVVPGWSGHHKVKRWFQLSMMHMVYQRIAQHTMSTDGHLT